MNFNFPFSPTIFLITFQKQNKMFDNLITAAAFGFVLVFLNLYGRWTFPSNASLPTVGISHGPFKGWRAVFQHFFNGPNLLMEGYQKVAGASPTCCLYRYLKVSYIVFQCWRSLRIGTAWVVYCDLAKSTGAWNSTVSRVDPWSWRCIGRSTCPLIF